MAWRPAGNIRQKRICEEAGKLGKAAFAEAPDAVLLKRVGNGGIEEMEQWADSVPNPRAIFIDAIKMVRRQQRARESLYDCDYSTIEPLRDLANRRRLAINGTHHLNKRLESDDPFDLVSGSNGMSAAADGTFILDRDGQGRHGVPSSVSPATHEAS